MQKLIVKEVLDIQTSTKPSCKLEEDTELNRPLLTPLSHYKIFPPQHLLNKHPFKYSNFQYFLPLLFNIPHIMDYEIIIWKILMSIPVDKKYFEKLLDIRKSRFIEHMSWDLLLNNNKMYKYIISCLIVLNYVMKLCLYIIQ